MAAPSANLKRLQIDKANLRTVIAIAIAVFIVVFCAVAVKSLVSRQLYQQKVIDKRVAANEQLKQNIAAAEDLTKSYKSFVAESPNVIGGNPFGVADKDGDNAKIVLDALPSVYDFPALNSSLEKIVAKENLQLQSIGGVDDEINQRGLQSGTPQVVEMPFTLTVNGAYQDLNNLVLQFERSIRPFKMTKITFSSGDNATVDVTIDAKSYYQPAKSIEIKKQVVEINEGKRR
jgi:hypothetical protein